VTHFEYPVLRYAQLLNHKGCDGTKDTKEKKNTDFYDADPPQADDF
jgi:hypothetical protein